MNHIIININIPDRKTGLDAFTEKRASRIIPGIRSSGIQPPASSSVEEADTIVRTHPYIKPAEKRKQSRVTVVPVILSVSLLPDKQISIIEQIGNVALDKDIAVHENKPIRK